MLSFHRGRVEHKMPFRSILWVQKISNWTVFVQTISLKKRNQVGIGPGFAMSGETQLELPTKPFH
jgi:hypothetical protein